MTQTSNASYLTQEAYDRLKKELDHISEPYRQEIVDRITAEDEAAGIARTLLFPYLNHAATMFESGYATKADIDYILGHVNKVLATPLTHDDIDGVYAGLRPLLAGESEETSKLSREHAVAVPSPASRSGASSSRP